MNSPSQENTYVLGHEADELARLIRQARFFEEGTESILRRAGLAKGMRVLDLGCGVGDVSLIAARIVGSSGSVLGIDRADDAIGVARQRAEGLGSNWIEFIRGEIGALEGLGKFDAIIGRFILLHFARPDEIVRSSVDMLGPGGVVVFAEMDITSASVTPRMPLLEKCLDWITELYERSGLEPDMGSRLYKVFRSVGLNPQLTARCHIEGGSARSGLDYVADTLQSMQPALAALNIVSVGALDITTLRGRLATEASKQEHCIIFPRLIGAWAKAA